jgi:hypothetical protein
MNLLGARATNWGIHRRETPMPTVLGPQMWLGSAILASVPIYVLLQILLAFIWRGGWRIAALVPLIVVVPALALTAYGALHESNLAPLPFIAVSPLALAYLLVAAAVHAVESKISGASFGPSRTRGER